MKRLAVLATVGVVFSPLTVAGQVPNDVVDRLVAIVGDSSVLKTQIDEELARLALDGTPVPGPNDPEYPEAVRGIVDQFVNRLLVIQAASRDSLIRVDEATIDERVAERIDQMALQFGGQPALQQALAEEGLTLAEYREIMKNEARAEQVQQLYYQSRIRDAAPEIVTEDEMLERFQEARGALQQRPKLLTFRQIVIKPEPSEESKDSARAEAESLLARVNAGEDFAALATQFSDDLGSAQLGGDLGVFRRGRMVREFEDAAFALFDGEVSQVVESDFGFHIIKVVRARLGERQARHILIMPETTEGDLDRARSLAADLLRRAQGGDAMSDLFDEFSDPAAPDSLTIPFEQLGDLPPAYGVLRTAEANDFIGPIDYQAGGGEMRVAIIQVIEIREAGAYTFQDLRPQIAGALQQEKQLKRLLDELRASTYVEIRM